MPNNARQLRLMAAPPVSPLGDGQVNRYRYEESLIDSKKKR